MPKPDSAWIPCMRCKRGSRGEKSCSAGWKARNLKTGCFNGELLDKFKNRGDSK